MIAEKCQSDLGSSAVSLRYFNPAGAHQSRLIGEHPLGIPGNLIPFLGQVAVGIRDRLTIHGDDYDIPGGSCIRDYIHVVDLARGHLAALHWQQPGAHTFNLVTGRGSSVLETVAAFREATGVDIPIRIGPRRLGDVDISYADVSLAADQLAWQSEFSLDDICRDTYRWQQMNPDGFPPKDS